MIRSPLASFDVMLNTRTAYGLLVSGHRCIQSILSAPNTCSNLYYPRTFWSCAAFRMYLLLGSRQWVCGARSLKNSRHLQVVKQRGVGGEGQDKNKTIALLVPLVLVTLILILLLWLLVHLQHLSVAPGLSVCHCELSAKPTNGTWQA